MLDPLVSYLTNHRICTVYRTFSWGALKILKPSFHHPAKINPFYVHIPIFITNASDSQLSLPRTLSMSALITSALFTLIVWANCYVNFVYTQSASSSALHSPVSDAVSRNSSESRAKESCRPGQGQVSHTLIYDPSEMWLHQAYKSSPYNPPELVITGNGQPRAPGLLFISPNRATKDTAPLIMTDTGQLVWNGPSVNASNLRVASFEGQSILTYWSGYSGGVGNLPEHGYGKVTFLDAQYREILTVCPHFNLWTDVNSPCQADFHESFVTDRDTILVTAYNITETDLSSHGASSRAWVYDSLFFEIYPRNGSIKFQWSALEHIPVNETKMHLTNELIPFDWFHINSVVNIGDKFLVNSRHCWTTYLLSANGTVEWTLQGDTGGDFGVLPPNGQFVSKFGFFSCPDVAVRMTI